MASYLLGTLFTAGYALVYGHEPEGFHVGILGYMGTYFFTVLDFASGSMSTAIACIHTNRKCICIEKDDMHFLRGEERIRNEYNIKRNVE